MLSPRSQNPESRGVDWLAITRIAVLQVVVLLALAGAVLRYLSWSSDLAWAEFSAANQLAVSEADPDSRAVSGPASQMPPVPRSYRLSEM
ncbi:MAG: hypothetical protein JF566_01820 [Bradyrhizobium sp.]|nr:hypothetical protein [Bradyrhizobium sp.]